ncbi:MAG: hypothetical protein FWH53_00315 [Leptospirales bacterium]|nr:hypothetical protein [Leptospirales bacterium]
MTDDIKRTFSRIKTDLKFTYDILDENYKYENFIKNDLVNIQRLTNNLLTKLKKSIAYSNHIKSQKGLFDDEDAK